MSLREHFTVKVLTAFDRLMDFITFDLWTKVRGDVVPKVKITKPDF